MLQYPELKVWDLWRRKVPSDNEGAKCPRCDGEDIVYLNEKDGIILWYCHSCSMVLS